MRKYSWLIIFFIVVTADLIAIQLDNQVLELISKPLLIPVLIAWFISSFQNKKTNLNIWVIVALIFSWLGDVLLLFQEKDSLFFLLGLGSFLLAHIFYIIFFHKLRILESIKANPWFLVLVVIYYAGLIGWISPFLADMKIPVRVYGIVISFMLMLAFHMLNLSNKSAGKWMLYGAVLFVISDSILAINKFYMPFEGAGLLIMASYALAQLFIVYGAMSYIRGHRILGPEQ